MLLISYVRFEFNLKILMPKFYVSALEVYALNRTSTDMKQLYQCLTPHCPSFLSTSCSNSGPTQPQQKISQGLFQSCAKVCYVCLLLAGGAACWVTLTHCNVRVRLCFDENTNKEDCFVNLFTVEVSRFGTWQRPLSDWFVFGNTV